jgi:SAM-dependent methyltransferase
MNKYERELQHWKESFATFASPEEYLKYRHWEFENMVSYLPNIMKYKDKTGLDLGCGVVSIFHDSGFNNIVAVDPLLNDYDEIFRPIESNVYYDIFYSDDGRIPFLDNACEFICCFNVIDHTYYHKELIQEIKRCLTPEGKLFLEVNFPKVLDPPAHVKLWDYETVLEELSSVFRQDRLVIERRDDSWSQCWGEWTKI